MIRHTISLPRRAPPRYIDIHQPSREDTRSLGEHLQRNNEKDNAGGKPVEEAEAARACLPTALGTGREDLREVAEEGLGQGEVRVTGEHTQ